MPTPPFAVPSGQTVVWLPAGSNVAITGGLPGYTTAVSTATTGIMTDTAGSPLNTPFAQITWSNYTASSILTGAVIHGIYPVAEVNGTNLHTFASLSLNGNYQTNPPWNNAETGAFSGVWYVSAGTSLSVIPSITIASGMSSTSSHPYALDTLNFSYVGVAVYIDTPLSARPPVVCVTVSSQQRYDVGFN